MKKLTIALLLVFFLVLPASASQQLSVLVNGIQLQQGAIMHNGSVYVPLRAVAESLDCDVGWDGQKASVTSNSTEEKATFARPEIQGDESFKKMINDALDLLYNKDAAHYALVVQNVDMIGQSDTDEVTTGGLNPNAKSVGREVIIFPNFIKSQHFVPKLIAATITHEASHAASYNAKGLFRDRKTEESMAYENEIATLKLVDAPSYIIKEREKLITTLNN